MSYMDSSAFDKMATASALPGVRELTMEEAECVSGGANESSGYNEIVVTASQLSAMAQLLIGFSTNTFLANLGNIAPIVPNLSGLNNIIGGINLPLISAGVSAAANDFADHHVTNAGQTLADLNAAQQWHDKMAQLYDFLKSNPNRDFDLGDGYHASGSKILGALSLTDVTINSGDPRSAGPTGAQTSAVHGGDGTTMAHVYVNPSDPVQMDYQNRWGAAGSNYVIFHELGHSIEARLNDSSNNFGEKEANTLGAELEIAMGIDLMSTPPTNGYVDGVNLYGFYGLTPINISDKLNIDLISGQSIYL